VLAVIGKIGTAGGTGYTIEFAGSAIRALSMEGRMTVCNMAIEAGARAGMVAVDDTTINYLKDRPYSPQGAEFKQAEQYWREFKSDPDAHFDRVIELNAAEIVPQVTWGTSPEMVTSIDGRVPDPEREKDPVKRGAIERALQYMALQPNTPIEAIKPDKIFIGSCTNARIEDLRAAAYVVKTLGRRVAPNIRLAMVVPGSGLVKQQAEREGLDKVFTDAGFEWRTRLLDVSCDELGPARAGRALRVDVEPQLRGAPGRGRAHAPREPGHGGGGRDRGPFRRHPQARLILTERPSYEAHRILDRIALRPGRLQHGSRLRRGPAASRRLDQQQGVEVSTSRLLPTQTGKASWKNSLFTAASWRRWIARTSTRTRSFRSSS